MDPKACFDELQRACAEGDMYVAADAAEDLAAWRDKGGFRPESIPADVWAPTALELFAKLCRIAAERNTD